MNSRVPLSVRHARAAARQGLDQTLASLTSEIAESAIAELLAPPDQPAAGAAVLDLMLIVPSVNQLGERTIDSPLLKLLSMAASNPTTDAAITARLQHLAAEYPDDFAVAVTQAIWGLRHGSGAAELDRIAQLVAARPLEPVPEGRRPNSRLAGGSGSDRLFFKYPLTGAFEFSFDRLSSPSNGSHVGYNGAIMNANGDYLHVRATGGHEDIDRQKMGLEQRAGGYERFKVVSDGRQVRFFVADHLVYEEPVTHTSPWLHLHAEGHQTCVYRNLQLTGTPEIPRSVPLFAANRMEGWVNVTREPQRPHRLLAEPPPADPDDYRNRQRLDQPDQYTREVADGVLTGRPRAGLSRTAAPNAQSDAWLGTQWSWLFYQRPLHDHDRVQYEFFYAPGQTEVHPALGRLAFLLRPDGVHTHWITQNGDRDLLQVPNANLMLETAYQRGGGALPFRTNDWNTFSLQVAGNVLTMELNGAAIFERPLAPGDDTRFGIFRNAALETRIRNAALSGDWPTSLPADVSDNLLALDQPLPDAEARIAAALLQRLAPRRHARLRPRHPPDRPPSVRRRSA